MKHEEPKELFIIIESAKPDVVEHINSFSRVMTSSNPTIAPCESKCKVSGVIDFQKKYEAEKSKSSFPK